MPPRGSIVARTRVRRVRHRGGLREQAARGGRVDFETPRLRARSFATTYVLILMFEKPYPFPWINHVIARRLRMIEALTIALPPPDGPGAESLGGKLRA